MAKKAAKSETKAAAKPPTKTEVIGMLADSTGLTKVQVGAVLDSLAELVTTNLTKRGSAGEFTIPGLVKFKKVEKKATKKKMGFNPQTREPMVIPAKPARKDIKVTAVKTLRDLFKK